VIILSFINIDIGIVVLVLDTYYRSAVDANNEIEPRLKGQFIVFVSQNLETASVACI
jgi:hypothetical protein